MPSTPVSIVIPVRSGREVLGRTLACLVHQTYPLDLIEIVVAADGCSDRPEHVVESFRDDFGGVRFLGQEDDGDQAIEVRNRAVEMATHENVIILDCDMAPTPRLVELYVRHLETFPNALYCGHRRYVDANDVAVDDIRRSIQPMLTLHDIETKNDQVGGEAVSRLTDSRLAVYASTGDLRFEPHPFRVVSGGNVGFTKSLFDISGGFEQGFADRHDQDVEWGFRVWNRGFFIVPLIDACGLRQGPPDGRGGADGDTGERRVPSRLADLCPVHFRQPDNEGGFTVPLVSIYMPAYNAEDTIVSAVQSALDQTVRDLEVCVVNDGSTDGTLARLREQFGNEPRVRIGDQENGGIGSASNRAVRMCRGAFIGQLDADDELTPDAVELLLAPMLRETRIGVSYGSFVKIDPAGELIGDAWVAARYSHFVILHRMDVHPLRLFRARDWHRTDGFAEDIRNAVDYDMYLKMAEVTEMLHVHERVYRYRVHEASTSWKHRSAQYRNHALVVGRALERRGLAEDWAMEPLDPDDARKYLFVETRGASQPPALPTSGIRAVGKQADIESKLGSALAGWNLEQPGGASTVALTSPPLSRARALRYAHELRTALADTNTEVEVAI